MSGFVAGAGTVGSINELRLGYATGSPVSSMTELTASTCG
jgi:hypothetical protein